MSFVLTNILKLYGNNEFNRQSLSQGIVANHGFEFTKLPQMMERIDEKHTRVTDNGPRAALKMKYPCIYNEVLINIP